MSFLNKIIDKAKYHQSTSNRGEDERASLGVYTPHSSTSSYLQQQQQQQQQALPKVQEENNHTAGYVTPRQSQDSHQRTDMDSMPGKNR
ncbi:hypothetical protein G6F43_012063 [Rhizopus delemar]|nr:hypothetical protein G6F43_012063 [Rhizopus delemar]